MSFSTAQSSGAPTPLRRNRVLQVLVIGYIAVWLWAAIAPVYRFDWALENLLLIAGIGWLVWNHRRHPFSDLSYALIATFLALHTYGSHYTYAEAPAGTWLAAVFGFERNHFDRVVHASSGFLLAYPGWELLRARLRLGDRLARWGTFLALATASLVYELIEWLAAMVVSPEAALAFLGTQGDVFDAQKDSALALIGAAVVLLAMPRESRRKRPDAIA